MKREFKTSTSKLAGLSKTMKPRPLSEIVTTFEKKARKHFNEPAVPAGPAGKTKKFA